MHENIFYNGEIIFAESVLIGGLSMAALYGKGIFTTVAILDKKVFFWEKHWKRLERSAKAIRIDISEISEMILKESLFEIINGNDCSFGRARITIFDESPGAFWPFKTKRNTAVMITTADFSILPQNFRLTISPYRINSVSPLTGIKCCNYLEKIIALNEAKDRGFDEAVCINERGEIASAVMANIFWLKDGKLFTPPLETGCLAGTTREYILENTDCFESREGVELICSADDVFLTSAGIGVVRVAEIDGRKLAMSSHEIFSLVPRSE
ncbi:aminotransferase class IV [soil metagenome]